MKPGDRNLGMDRPISRRDLLLGMGALATSSLVPSRALAEQMLAMERAGDAAAGYPPALTGLRGSHVGSFEVAHQLAHDGRRDWGPIQEPDPDLYDLVVVGAGLSGLAAAHFYRKGHPNARILILDNHDDFGGHAKRNELRAGGRTLIGYGGSQSLTEPGEYSHITKDLLRDIGVKPARLDAAYDYDFFSRNGLAGGIYFDRETFGVDRTLPYPLVGYEGYLPLAPSPLSHEEAVAQMPISEAAKREMIRLLTSRKDTIPDVSYSDEEAYLETISYRDFLIKHMGIREPEVFAILQDQVIDWGLGIEAVSAENALGFGLPGINATSQGGFRGRITRWYRTRREEKYTYHFPDGNASLARLLVRSLVPAVAPGTTMEDVVMARFDYSKLDEGGSPVRLRLLSTVVDVEHDGAPNTAKRVGVTYVRNGQAGRVWARNCVLACYNSAIPYLCPELPAAQRKALANQVKVPILYTNVAVRNWQPWKKLGIGAVIAPGSYHINAMLDFPVSFGGQRYPRNPDEPVLIHMERFPHRSNQGMTPSEQHRAGRYEMLSTSYESIERSIRLQLSGTLADGGFDPARDIEAITVNRWAHGYSHWPNSLFEPYYDDRDDMRNPHMQARKHFGRIAIANSDAAASANLDAAIDQAHRAISEFS